MAESPAGVTPKQDKRFRKQYRFWLDLAVEAEASLALRITDLTRNRLFSKTILNGLRLMLDLYQFRVDVLLALFPWVRARLLEMEREATREQVAHLRDEIAELKFQLKNFSSFTPNGEGATMDSAVGELSESPQGSRIHRSAKVDELIITTPAADPNDKPAWNNHISLAKLLGTYDHLSPEMIAYGIRTGLLNAKQFKSRSVGAGPRPAQLEGNNPKPMNVPRLHPPVIPDEALDNLL